MRIHRTLAIAIAVLAAPLWAGQEPPPGDPPATDVTIGRRDQLTPFLGFGGPLGATLRLDLLHGLGADVRDSNEQVDAVCALPIPYCARGFLLEAEAGSGGGKLAFGLGAIARVRSEDFQGAVGAGLKLSVVRTWGSPIGTDPGLTYLGPELDVSIKRFGVALGVLWKVSGDGGSTALLTWDLSIRLRP